MASCSNFNEIYIFLNIGNRYCNTTHTRTTFSTEERIKQKLPQLFQNHILCAGTTIGNQAIFVFRSQTNKIISWDIATILYFLRPEKSSLRFFFALITLQFWESVLFFYLYLGKFGFNIFPHSKSKQIYTFWINNVCNYSNGLCEKQIIKALYSLDHLRSRDGCVRCKHTLFNHQKLT